MWQMTAPRPTLRTCSISSPESLLQEKALSPEAETVSIAPASVTVYRFPAATFQLLPYIEGRSALHYTTVPE